LTKYNCCNKKANNANKYSKQPSYKKDVYGPNARMKIQVAVKKKEADMVGQWQKFQ